MKNNDQRIEQMDELAMAFEDRWSTCNCRHHGHPHTHHLPHHEDFQCSASSKAKRRAKRTRDLMRDDGGGR